MAYYDGHYLLSGDGTSFGKGQARVIMLRVNLCNEFSPESGNPCFNRKRVNGATSK
jgi:hypothetical protein